MCLSTHSFVQFCKVNMYPYTPGPLSYHYHLNAPSCWFLYPGDNPSCLCFYSSLTFGSKGIGTWRGMVSTEGTASQMSLICWVKIFDRYNIMLLNSNHSLLFLQYFTLPCNADSFIKCQLRMCLGVLPQNCLKCWQKFYRKPSCLWALCNCTFLITQTNQ